MGALLLLALLAISLGNAAEETQLVATQLGPVELWKQRAGSAAQVVEEALRRQDASKEVEVKHVDLGALRIWNGQKLELALEVDRLLFKFITQSEPEWMSLAEALPLAEQPGGGFVPKTDWAALERDWVAPVAQGSLLPDFILEGPLDLYLSEPTALQMYLPHAVDMGRVRRVLLREGACVTVRGARSVGLRRPVDLPSLSLSDFASLLTSDAEEHPAAGILHLISGVRSAAEQRWNITHPDLSLAVVALDLELSPQSAALLSVPCGSGRGGRAAAAGLQRLRPRQLKEGVVELVPRDSLSAEASKALALASGAPYAWPLRSVHPQHLQAYEQLLREVLSSHVFSGGRLAAGGQAAGAKDKEGMRVVPDMQLRLHKTQAEAMTMLQLRLEVDRRPKPGAVQGGDGSATAASAEDGQRGEREDKEGQGGEKAELGRPPDMLALLTEPKYGPHEVWDAVVQVKQDPENGVLRFVPLTLNRAGATKQTVSFSPAGVGELVGNSTLGSLAAQLMAQQAQREEL